MSAALVAVALVLLTAALLLEEASWQRRQRKQSARRAVPPVKCLVCPGTPMVDDFRAHSALAHQPREVGAEDHAEWSAA